MSEDREVVLVTGATRGIGRATVLKFIGAGAAVTGIYLSNDEAADELRRFAAQKGGSIRLFKGSVTDRTFVTSVVSDIVEQHGRLDVLVNNTGKANDQLVLTMTEEQWNDCMETNFFGTYNCMLAVLPHMLKQGGGRIVNVLSVSGIYGRQAQSNYAASKGAILGLTKLFARKYASAGISVHAVAPGMIDTDMLASVDGDKISDYLRHTSQGRLGTAEEIAEAIFYLAQPSSAYMTGQVLKIDGGFLR